MLNVPEPAIFTPRLVANVSVVASVPFPSRTTPVAAPKLASAATWIVPVEMSRPSAKRLLPVRISVPLPNWATVPAPEITPPKVIVSERLK